MADIQNPNHNNDNAVSSLLGWAFAFLQYLLNIDIAAWATQTILEIIKVAIVSAVGAASGLIIKKVIEPYLPRIAAFFSFTKNKSN